MLFVKDGEGEEPRRVVTQVAAVRQLAAWGPWGQPSRPFNAAQ